MTAEGLIGARLNQALYPAGEPLDPQEPFGIILVVAAAAFHRRDLGIVEAERTGAFDDRDVALVKAERDFAGNRLLGWAIEGHQGVHLGRVPEAVIDHFRNFR